jgi:hypothetical protein
MDHSQVKSIEFNPAKDVLVVSPLAGVTFEDISQAATSGVLFCSDVNCIKVIKKPGEEPAPQPSQHQDLSKNMFAHPKRTEKSEKK